MQGKRVELSVQVNGHWLNGHTTYHDMRLPGEVLLIEQVSDGSGECQLAPYPPAALEHHLPAHCLDPSPFVGEGGGVVYGELHGLAAVVAAEDRAGVAHVADDEAGEENRSQWVWLGCTFGQSVVLC